MPMRDRYTTPVTDSTWDVPVTGAARFNWEYDGGRDRLLSLYQKGKDKQWDAQSRIDWTLDVDPMNPIGMPDEFHPLFGSPAWESADESRRAEMRQHNAAWNFSQFLHGEQGAMVCAAKIVEVVGEGLSLREVLLESREAGAERVPARIDDFCLRQDHMDQADMIEIVRHLVDEQGLAEFAVFCGAVDEGPAEPR